MSGGVLFQEVGTSPSTSAARPPFHAEEIPIVFQLQYNVHASPPNTMPPRLGHDRSTYVPWLWLGSWSLHSITYRDGVLRLVGVSPDRGVSEDAQEQQRSHPLPVTREHTYKQERVRARENSQRPSSGSTVPPRHMFCIQPPSSRGHKTVSTGDGPNSGLGGSKNIRASKLQPMRGMSI